MRRFRSALRLLPPMLLPALVLLLSACRIEPNPRPQVLNVDSAARADIRGTMAAYREALLSNDARAIAAFYTADARLSEPAAPDRVGGREIHDDLAHFFAEGGRITDVVVESEEIHVDGPVAWELGTYREQFRTPAGADASVRGPYVIRWRRGEEARWRIDRFLLKQTPSDSAAAGMRRSPPAAAPGG